MYVNTWGGAWFYNPSFPDPPTWQPRILHKQLDYFLLCVLHEGKPKFWQLCSCRYHCNMSSTNHRVDPQANSWWRDLVLRQVSIDNTHLQSEFNSIFTTQIITSSSLSRFMCSPRSMASLMSFGVFTGESNTTFAGSKPENDLENRIDYVCDHLG